eukprot:COSAG01_NODE_3910_length_5551_cov_3.620139_1_plen_83_part_00
MLNNGLSFISSEKAARTRFSRASKTEWSSRFDVGDRTDPQNRSCSDDPSGDNKASLYISAPFHNFRNIGYRIVTLKGIGSKY